MNTETQMVADRLKKDNVVCKTIEEVQAFVDKANPSIFGHNEKGQWSWRIAREQKEKVNWYSLI